MKVSIFSLVPMRLRFHSNIYNMRVDLVFECNDMEGIPVVCSLGVVEK